MTRKGEMTFDFWVEIDGFMIKTELTTSEALALMEDGEKVELAL